MKRVVTSCMSPCFFCLAERETIIITSQVTVRANITATRAVTGSPVSACETDRVMTPVIVPGLAANRTRGASGLPASSHLFQAVGDVVPRSIKNPIQVSGNKHTQDQKRYGRIRQCRQAFYGGTQEASQKPSQGQNEQGRPCPCYITQTSRNAIVFSRAQVAVAVAI